MIPLAFDRLDLADYVNALFIVYTALVLCNVLLSFVPRIPYNPTLRAVIDFITESTNPYLNIFRRMTRPFGPGIDISPILALVVLGIAQAVLVGAVIE